MKKVVDFTEFRLDKGFKGLHQLATAIEKNPKAVAKALKEVKKNYPDEWKTLKVVVATVLAELEGIEGKKGGK